MTNSNVVPAEIEDAISIPKHNIGALVSFAEDSRQIAMVRGYSTEDGNWVYTLSHSINGMNQANEAELVSHDIDDAVLMRMAELFLMRAQRSYRGLVEDREFSATLRLTQYSDTHDTVITHQVIGGGGYGANNVNLEGDDLMALVETAKWDMHKRLQLAPKQLTRYRG